MAGKESHTSGVAGRYAIALLELAVQTSAVESVSRDLASLKALLASSPDLSRLVRAPIFSAEDQRSGMDCILRRMEAVPLTVRFVLTLTRKRRLFVLPEIIRAFESLVARQKGEIDAEVVAARALSESETDELRQALKARLGRDARLTAKVDPRLLGGLVVKVGSRMIDSSLRAKLEGLRSAMRGH